MKTCINTLVGAAIVAQLAVGQVAAQPATPAPAARAGDPAPTMPVCYPGSPVQPRSYWERRRSSSRPENSTRRNWWAEGELVSPQCQIEALQQGLAMRNLVETEVSMRAAEIRRLYQVRARRQQRWLDLASGGVFFGAAGSLASTGAGAVSQTVWGYATLAPVIVAQFNGNEPTRDLFHGAGIGLDLISARYAAFRRASDLLNAFDQASADNFSEVTRACVELDRQIAVAAAWSENSPDRAAIYPEAHRIAGICDQFTALTSGISVVSDASDLWKINIPYLYATDVLSLHATVVQRDHDLRYTPLETLAGIAALPLQAASTLLTGQNGRQAIDGLRTQTAFQSLTMRLSAMDIPTFDVPTLPQVTIAEGALRRHQRTQAAANAPEREVRTVLDAMERAAAVLNSNRDRLAYAATLYRALRYAAEANELRFTYDAPTRMIQISVGKPAVQDAPLVQVGNISQHAAPAAPPASPAASD